MAKGSVRKKGKKWYYRFYVEDASGKMVQKEYAGTESKSETEKLLRKALEDYENKKFVAKADNLTVGELLDMWAEEELKTGTLSNGTVENYLGVIRYIKKHPIADRKLKTVTAEHLQAFLDLLTFGGEFPDGKVRKGYSKDYIHSFSAVLQQSFRFAVFPKQLISFNPMQYIKLKKQAGKLTSFPMMKWKKVHSRFHMRIMNGLSNIWKRKIHLLFCRFKLRIMPGSVSGKPVVLHGRTLTLRNNA